NSCVYDGHCRMEGYNAGVGFGIIRLLRLLRENERSSQLSQDGVKMKETYPGHEWFIAECRQAFDFLVSEYGFAGPEVECDDTIHFMSVFYTKGEIGIECELDEREQHTSVLVYCLLDGKKPDAVYRDKNGRLVRQYLTLLLKKCGMKECRTRFKKFVIYKTLPKIHAEARRSLIIEAELLKEYGQSILNGSAEIFD
ncbi:MAG: hypothetical protein ABFD91_12240, partial [Anaerohalosphaeraceae bacterium]